MAEMKNVLIATPSYDGNVNAWYTHSLVETAKYGLTQGINFVPVVIENDALIQRARNDLAKIAASDDFDCTLWIDGDVRWDPQWAVDLVNRPEDVVGGTYRKKTDDSEMYVVNVDDLTIHDNGLMKVKSLGMGFVKVSTKASIEVFENSQPYRNAGGKDSHMVFDIAIVDGDLHGEDTVFFSKLKKLGYEIWMDPQMTLSHIGSKKFDGNFSAFSDRIKAQAASIAEEQEA